MSILELLGFTTAEKQSTNNDGGLQEIAERLDGLPGDRALMVAALAAVLARVAGSDLVVSDEESSRMVGVVREVAGCGEADARQVIELAVAISTQRGASHDYIATRELKRLAGPQERERLLHFLFAIAAADESITLDEEEEVRQVATELGFEHADYVRARAAFREHREVLRNLPGRG